MMKKKVCDSWRGVIMLFREEILLTKSEQSTWVKQFWVIEFYADELAESWEFILPRHRLHAPQVSV